MERSRQEELRPPSRAAVSPPRGALQPQDGFAAGEGVFETASRILRRQWLVVLYSVVAATTLAVGLAASQEKEYTASASLLFSTGADPVLTGTGAVDPQRVAATNQSLLGLGVVAQDTAVRLGDRLTASEVTAAVSVVSEPDADLVEVQATTTNPRLSAEVANEYANAFIAFRKRSARRQIEEALALAQTGQAAMTPEQRNGAEGQALQARINEFETAKSLQTGGVELVQSAAVPTAPSSPHPKRDGILGGLLGAIFGFALASVRARRDHVLRNVDELEAVSGWPVLARLPTSRLFKGAVELPPRGVEAEAFRMLRASLRYFSVNYEIHSLLITSARSGEGKSVTAHRLAEVMASMGDHVVLVEADMHRGNAAELDVELAGGGLSGFLIGQRLDDVLVELPIGHPDDARTLNILPSGPLPPNPSELLESERMHELMVQLEERFDLVILDSPPLPVLSDASALVGHASAALVVVALGKSTPDDVREVASQMTLLGGDVLGVVANLAPSSDRYYDERYYGARK